MSQRTFRHRRGLRILAILSLSVLIPTIPAALTHSITHAATTPKRGGTLNIRLPAVPDCLDPYKSGSAAQSTVTSNVLLGMTSLNQKLKPIPGIAEKWKIANGGKTITFTLRPGVKFSDGNAVTSADIKASYAHALDPATKSPVSKGFLSQVTSISTPNTSTVVLHLSTPSRIILFNLASNYLGILEKKQLAKLGDNTCNGTLVGTGPYKFGGTGTALSTITLKLNKYYFNFNRPWANNKGQPYIPTVNYNTITSDATAVSEFLAGQLTITDVPGAELTRVQGSSNVVQHKILAQAQYLLEFNSSHAPFNNIAVRKAVAEAVDRSQVIKGAFNNLAKPVYSPLPPTIAYSDPKAQSEMPKLNPGAAEAAIAAAGAKGPYTLLSFTTPTNQSATEIIQAELANVGMNVNIVTKTVGDGIAAANKGEFDIFLLSWSYSDPDVLYLLYNSTQGGGKGLNFTNLPNAQVDSLTVKGRADLNAKQAKGDYIEAQQILMKNLIVDPLVTPVSITATPKKLKGWHTSLSGAVLLQDLYFG